MPVHCKQDDVHDPANVGAILDSEDVEEVVEDVLQHRRPVEVLLTGYQNLSLIRVARDLKYLQRKSSWFSMGKEGMTVQWRPLIRATDKRSFEL